MAKEVMGRMAATPAKGEITMPTKPPKAAKARAKPDGKAKPAPKKAREKKAKPLGVKAAAYKFLAHNTDADVADIVAAIEKQGLKPATGTIRATRRSFKSVFAALVMAGRIAK